MSHERERAVADSMIRKDGQASKLRRGDVDRDCWAVEAHLNNTDKKALKNFSNRVFLITPVGLTVPPDDKEDAFLWLQDGVWKLFRIDAPVSPLAPGGTTIYYEIQAEGGRDVDV